MSEPTRDSKSFLHDDVLHYELSGEYIDSWLIAGPTVSPSPTHDPAAYSAGAAHILDSPLSMKPISSSPPAELESLTIEQPDGQTEELLWRVWQCREDHAVDLTGHVYTDKLLPEHLRRAWAYCGVVVAESCDVTLRLDATGSTRLWLNGEQVCHHKHPGVETVQTIDVDAKLKSGRNDLCVEFDAGVMGTAPMLFRLQALGLGDGVGIIELATTFSPVERRQALVRIMAQAYLDIPVYHRDDQLQVRWPQEMNQVDELTVRLQKPPGRIYAEGTSLIQAGTALKFGKVSQFPAGEYEIRLMAKQHEFYVLEMKVDQRIPLRIVNSPYSNWYYGDYEQRRREALNAAADLSGDLFGEMAKMDLGQWAKVQPDVVRAAIACVNYRCVGCEVELLGLLGIVMRYAGNDEFSTGLAESIADCVVNYPFAVKGAHELSLGYGLEGRQILRCACQVLAGQMFPERTFAEDGHDGNWQLEQGRRQALTWLQARGRSGFGEWDAPNSFAVITATLAHLTDLATDDGVAEMAAVVLDKLFFGMAVNSYRGVLGGTHGRCRGAYLQNGILEPTSGICRLLWGMGSFNDEIAGTVSLACARGYAFPELIAVIALDQTDEVWSRERHMIQEVAGGENSASEVAVNKVTYKTPDYLLSSAQDYRPGQPGNGEHVWQATLGTHAVVFANHPGWSSRADGHAASYWRGNGTLPRAAQWKDVLIVVYRMPSTDRMGFTHAYFPTAVFDEVIIEDGTEDGWVFARKGNGYLALRAANGLALLESGQDAFRELRSEGRRNVWICQMGRAALDGSFGEFVKRVRARPLTMHEQAVQYASLRGEEVEFGWERPLRVDGVEQSLSNFGHYENPYCAVASPVGWMDIEYQGHLLRLQFD